MVLFTQNSDLRKTGIFGWTLPAHWVTLSNGQKFNTCPNAGICGAFCYAKTGTFQFSNVKKAHLEKLELVLNNRPKWLSMMQEEISKPKYANKYIRIHDAGDFFSEQYALDWLDLAKNNPKTIFYTYTKEVELFKVKLAELIPNNFIVIYSFGGKQDNMIDVEVDRHSDVFHDYDEMIAKGYNDIGDDDKQSAINPNHKVGLYRNNIKHFVKKMGNKNFSEWGNKKHKKMEKTDETKLVKVSEIKPNPKNPRTIKDSKFKKLVKSIQEFPEMLDVRPIVVDEDMVILGGNMRFKAICEAGIKEVRILQVKNLTPERKDEFIIKDNANYGDWDWDILANQFQQDNLSHWGLDVWEQSEYTKFAEEETTDDSDDLEHNKPSSVEVHKPVILQLEFEIGDYQTAQELVNKAKSKGMHIGKLLIQSMKISLGHGVS